MSQAMVEKRTKTVATVMMTAWACCALTGCSLWRPNKDRLDEYDQASRDINSYEDKDGNFIRPEGLRADKRRSTPLPGFLKSVPYIGEKPVDKEKCNKIYAEAEAVFESAKSSTGADRAALFRRAAKLYNEAGKYWISSAKEQDALLMAGESSFFAEDYTRAENYYAKLVKDYPRTRYLDLVDARRMAISLYWLQVAEEKKSPFEVVNLTDKKLPWSDVDGHGRRVLEKLRLDNPTGKLADDATMELANEAFKKNDYQTAADTYADLRMTYPDSPHLFKAHFLGLKAIVETYEGPEYDASSLDEAEKLVKKIVRSFPKEAQEEQAYLNRIFAEIRYKKAERLWFQADYRMKRGENNSARLYLNDVIKDFADTPFADQAKEALTKLEDLPGDPPQRFEWLADLFPESDRVKPLVAVPEAKSDGK
jgi:outer membrane protein assembly factor BamD (BamD/ComL family)